MNHRFLNFIRGLRGVTISDAAFARIRATLSQYADLHAITDRAVSPVPVLSPFVAFFKLRGTMYAGALVLFVVVAGGGVAGGAERSLPGDALYSVKVNVNEKVAASLADTSVERAELSAKLATRRADEALTLLAEGKLDPETATYLEGELAVHVEESNAAAAVLESEGDIASSLMVQADLAEELESRVVALEASSAPAADTAEVSTFMAAKSAGPVDPGTQLAQGLRAQVERIAEARSHASATLMPGIEDAPLDLADLAPDSATTDAAVSATLMIEGADAASSTEKARAKFAPPPNSAWPADQDPERRPFWLPGGR